MGFGLGVAVEEEEVGRGFGVEVGDAVLVPEDFGAFLRVEGGIGGVERGREGGGDRDG